MEWSTVITALVIGLPSTLLGVLAYRRSKTVDAVAQQSGVVSENRAGTAQIIQALNDLIDNLQVDNKAFREDIKYLTGRVDMFVKEREECKAEVARLRKKCGEDEDGNPDQPLGRHRVKKEE